MADPNIQILYQKTLLQAIQNSVGTKLFNTLFVKFKDSGEEKDILNDGEYSCAFFVSSLLVLVKVLDKPSATVVSLKKDITENDKWRKVESTDVEPGDVVFYKAASFEDGSSNEHVGFALGNGQAISTNYKQKQVVQHELNTRPVSAIYRYSWN